MLAGFMDISKTSSKGLEGAEKGRERTWGSLG